MERESPDAVEVAAEGVLGAPSLAKCLFRSCNLKQADKVKKHWSKALDISLFQRSLKFAKGKFCSIVPNLLSKLAPPNG